MVITNSSGDEVKEYDYDPFGRISEETSSLANTHKFIGKELDIETGLGLYYFGARYYDPEIGRFITPDPGQPDLNDPQTLNPYVYCVNNPLRYLDPTGMFWEEIKEFLGGIFNVRQNMAEQEFQESLPEAEKEELENVDTPPTLRELGQNTGATLANSDIVTDVSVTVDASVLGLSGLPTGTFGISVINGRHYYFHVGGGGSVSLSPISASVGGGLVKNFSTPEGYSGRFYDVNAAAFVGTDYAFSPKGVSARSITLTSDIAIGGRVDYYILLK